MATREVQGLSQLLANMQQLPRELVSTKGGLVRHALFKPVKLVRDLARQKAPKRTGNLARNIIAVRDRDPERSGASERYIIGVRKKRWTKKAKNDAKRNARGHVIKGADNNDAFYWRFPEFGTAKMPAHPYMRPAFEETKGEQVSTFKDDLAQGIQNVVARMRK
jgi:HK97 gp10 family phage protein